MLYEDVEQLAKDWADAWNNRDIERVLAHFHDDVIFTSPTAVLVLGIPTVKGKDALRAYWNAAMNRIQSLQFTVHRVLWDPRRSELAIIYTSEINGNKKKVSENLTLDKNGLVVTAEVFHGIG